MAADSEGAGLGSSMTDLMTSLAVIFILLLVASYNDGQEELDEQKGALAETAVKLGKAEQELLDKQSRTDTNRSELLVALQKALESFAAQEIRVTPDPRDPLSLLVIVPEVLLKFALNEDKIPQNGVEFLGKFIPRLAETVCTFKEEISAIVIEGHTDRSGTDAINLPLSQARSMAVVRESLDVLGKITVEPGNASLSDCFLDLLSASGRGSREPRSATRPQDNRRVEFKIRVRSLEQRQQPIQK